MVYRDFDAGDGPVVTCGESISLDNQAAVWFSCHWFIANWPSHDAVDRHAHDGGGVLPVCFGLFVRSNGGRKNLIVFLLVVVLRFFGRDCDTVKPFHPTGTSNAGCNKAEW